jgi:hypothetical protein
VADNDIEVFPNQCYGKKHWICDGEGIMHENHVNAKVKDVKIVGNKSNAYICIWRVEVDGLEIRDNEVNLRQEGAVIGAASSINIKGRKRSIKGKPYCPVRGLTIVGNRMRGGGINVLGTDGEGNEVRRNVALGAELPLVVENLQVEVSDNRNFKIYPSEAAVVEAMKNRE